MGSIHPSPATDRSWMDIDVIPHIVSRPLPYITTVLVTVVLVYYIWTIRLQKLPPLLNAPGWLDIGSSLAKLDFEERAASLLKTASEKFADKPVRIETDTGNLIILPPNHLTEEVRNNPDLSMLANSQEDFHGRYPGFEPFNAQKTASMLLHITRNQLTKYLTKLTEPVSSEATIALYDLLGDSPEWREISAPHTSVRYVSRLSSRIFLGDEICRSKAWLEVTSRYTMNIMPAVKRLRLFPKFTRPFVHWLLPECRLSRKLINEARIIMQAALDQREADDLAATREGRPIPCRNDAIEWSKQESKNISYDPAVFQIAISMAAIHTTSDLLTKTLQSIVPQPDLIDALRKEIIEVFQTEKMTKAALLKLKLMDSVLKETQRLTPLKMTAMHRMALADVTLSDGTVIPKGAKCAVRSTKRLDAAVYENPGEFDGRRFLRMRDQPGRESQAHLVTIGTESLGFGFGMHACPGRFFAANELKIALAHLLLKYDLKPPAPGYAMQPVLEIGFDLRVDPNLKILVRRRQAEVDLDVL